MSPELPLESDDQWIGVLEEASKVPFEFAKMPAVRFILLQSADRSDILIVCHHILCDGMSLAYLARDLMVHLGDLSRKAVPLPDPVLLTRDTIPDCPGLNPLVRGVINRINKKWQRAPAFFDQQDYENLAAAYWANVSQKTSAIELSEEQTSALVNRCRSEQVTVNSALTAAFVAAQIAVQGPKPHHNSFGIAGSLRQRMTESPGEAMGFYTGVVTLKHTTNLRIGFWEDARRLHRRAKRSLTNRRLFNDALTWSHLDPSILEAMNFKKLGGLVSPDAPRHAKLSAFATRDDVVHGILKRGRMESLEQVIMGTAITNLTRMDFPRRYGNLELERLILQPGGAFPLTQVGLVVGAVTCSGKLSLVLEHAEEVVSTTESRYIGGRALELLQVE